MYCPGFARPWRTLEPKTALNDLDSKQIVEAFSKKLQSHPGTHIAFVAMLLGYICANFGESDFDKGIAQALQANSRRLWIEVLKVHQLNLEQWGDLTTHVGSIFSVLVM